MWYVLHMVCQDSKHVGYANFPSRVNRYSHHAFDDHAEAIRVAESDNISPHFENRYFVVHESELHLFGIDP